MDGVRPPNKFAQEYLDVVQSAVLSSKKVAHFDLRPENIFCRICGDVKLEMKILDFEDSIFFGRKIAKASLYEGDPYHRYPIFNKEDHYAGERHNALQKLFAYG